ncbi:helix-turn-helix domain-containing protein [Pseudodesulfovibrio cashew]|uniref:Helix-turn-helix domain-containing protein n=1 Tax=Pseudodesulfovibrio cashew TaxID=2678688 RepID=A0A6I6JKT3_9BACT|nr:helix-turn-helix domain-containing protein [Pseudodesulfovibrio cashew]QGY40913.1 helix-turn-helix domain-containing protein [Pseudodesulfovibrio cashew]
MDLNELFRPVLDAIGIIDGRLACLEERLGSSPSHSGYLTTHEAAEFLSLSPQTLELWRHNSEGPRYVKLGRAVRYAVADLIEYMERNQIMEG